MIIVGIGHIALKSYTPHELGLTEASWNGMMFEAVQQYFHVMFIPCFPLNQIIETRDQRGKNYPLTSELKKYVDRLELKHETPWYTFIGLVVGLSGFIAIITHILRK
jgi:hypothetical protein